MKVVVLLALASLVVEPKRIKTSQVSSQSLKQKINQQKPSSLLSEVKGGEKEGDWKPQSIAQVESSYQS